MPAEVKLSPNIPLQLALADPSGVPEDFRVHFPTSDGRVLTLPRQTAIELNLLDLRPGEAFCICKDWDGTHGKPATYRIWLPAATEQERAAEEAEAEPEPILPQPLTVGRGRKPAKRDEQPRLFDRGTGTYGPAIQPVPEADPAPMQHARRQAPPEAIPMNIAFREVVRFVVQELRNSGEQWSDQSRQDLISTLIIAAQKQQLLKVWER